MSTLRSENFQYFKELIIAAHHIDVLWGSVLCWRSERIAGLAVEHNSLFHISTKISLVRICAANELDKNTADTPHVYLGVIVLLYENDFWWSVESWDRMVWKSSSCLGSQCSFALKPVRKMDLTVSVIFGLHRTQRRSGTHDIHALWVKGHIRRTLIDLHGVIKLVKVCCLRFVVTHNCLVAIVQKCGYEIVSLDGFLLVLTRFVAVFLVKIDFGAHDFEIASLRNQKATWYSPWEAEIA